VGGSELKDRVAIVTGAASGIGAASAAVLADQGARVCCADRDASGAERIAKQIATKGGEAFAVEVDVTDPDANQAMVDAVKARYGALHLAHLNAGVSSAGEVLEIPVQEWDRVIAVNLRGVFLGLQACGRAIAEAGGGAMVLTSSTVGLGGSPTAATYSAAKHGVIGLMKCAAIDLAVHGIRINAVCPGATDTPMLGPLHGRDEALASILGRRHPIGRVGAPGEVAQVVAFLLSERASNVTGASVPVDGGMTCAVTGIDREINAAEVLGLDTP
jgi:NAD(P)-dependent dehydrogenase (short-subunit alcohol dehydrogenase family)